MSDLPSLPELNLETENLRWVIVERGKAPGPIHEANLSRRDELCESH